nr:hypothetical protein [Tanacetum cinerariifolium]
MPMASARKKRGDSDTSLTPPIATLTPITTVAPVPRLSAAAKDEGTGSRPGVPDVPSDDSEEELSWNSSDDEDVDAQDEGDKNDESDDGTPDRDWNKTLPAAQGNAQSWISELARQTDARSSFNELLDTPIDFSNFIMNWLSVDTLTPELLAGPTFKLMRGSCNILTELEYHLEEVYKATTDQLDWVNPEGQ